MHIHTSYIDDPLPNAPLLLCSYWGYYGESLSSSYVVLSEANLADLKTVTMIEVSTCHVSVYAFRCCYHDTSNGNLVYTLKLKVS